MKRRAYHPTSRNALHRIISDPTDAESLRPFIIADGKSRGGDAPPKSILQFSGKRSALVSATGFLDEIIEVAVISTYPA